MSHAFADIAFTPAVQAAQTRDGSRANCAHSFEGGEEVTNDSIGERERAFIAAQRSFYIATVSETGWPYLQHRGGPRGFLKVLNDKTLAFADYAGNRQLISVGNLSGNDRVALILMDYTQRVRLKLLGRLAVKNLAADDALAGTLVDMGAHQPRRLDHLEHQLAPKGPLHCSLLMISRLINCPDCGQSGASFRARTIS